MNEIISALQSAIALNRKLIRDTHKYFEDWKDHTGCLDEYGVKYYSTKIAQLVRIQKMLKKQLAKEIAEEKQEREFNKFWEENSGEDYKRMEEIEI